MTRGADLPNPTSVASARKAEANRRNARASTGPRTVAGKARAAQNARRHGLNLPARYDPSRSGGIVTLARAIAGPMPGRNASSWRPGSPPRRSTSSGRGRRASTSIRRRCASATRSPGSRPSTATRGARCRCASAPCATSTMRPIEPAPARWPAFRRNEATGRRCAGWWATAALASPACPSRSPQGRSTRGMARRLH